MLSDAQITTQRRFHDSVSHFEILDKHDVNGKRSLVSFETTNPA
jgi:hypothetical protein